MTSLWAEALFAGDPWRHDISDNSAESHPRALQPAAIGAIVTNVTAPRRAETRNRKALVGHISEQLVVERRPARARTDLTTADRAPAAWAERVAGLDPEQPPGDVPLARWRRFIDDSGRFLDGPFCAVAVALGWGSLDLFGCNAVRPYARIDQVGLIWLLDRNRIAALTAMSAIIETETGARQTYGRKSDEFGRVLAWELKP
jgi:hypothetical protein